MMPSTHQPQILPPRTRKRKAPTMSVKKWRPAENRIKELWVDEEKSLEELQHIVNGEFGFTANVRQYKGQIKRMKLERNTKEDDRKPIVRHLEYRKRKGKKTKGVRVKGHEITQAKIIRWRKEQASPSLHSSPSPLPSYVSVLSGSPSGSPATLLRGFSPVEPITARSGSSTDELSGAIQKLFTRADDESVTLQEAKPVFNALQTILGCDRKSPKSQDSWDAFSEDYITWLKNPQLNINQNIEIRREWNSTLEDGPRRRNLSRRFDRHASWRTAYGMVQMSLATRSKVSHYGSWHQENLPTMDEVLATRITFVPKQKLNCPFAAVFDFSLGHDPFARITYQATIPKKSPIFQVVKNGDVDGLIRMLEDGTGRLTDRDEGGRSLLNYSLQKSRVGMTKFLIEKGQDPDSFEKTETGFPGLLHGIGTAFQREQRAERRHRKIECHRLVLEAGADFSLPSFFDGESWQTGFQYAFLDCHVETFEHLLKFGTPFISPNTEFLDVLGDKRSALSSLAQHGGYMTSDVIQIVDKAILLLKGKADISYRDADGDSVLHTLLRCDRAHEGNHTMFEKFSAHKRGYWNSTVSQFFLSLTEPKQLLVIFLSAGADVHAVNKKGETPSLVAKKYDREREWNEALTRCGLICGEIVAHTELSSFSHVQKRQSPRLSFEEVCRERQEYLKFKERFFEDYCRLCGEPYDPSLSSLAEQCEKCGEKFRYREESLDSQYEPLREKYLREKESLTYYRRQREQETDEKFLKFKRRLFEASCRDCGSDFQPGLGYSPERCLHCGAEIGMTRCLVDACFEEGLVDFLILLRSKHAKTPCFQIFHEDENTDWSEGNSSNYDGNSDYGSESDHSTISYEAGDIQTNHESFMTFDAEMANSNMTERPRTAANYVNLQAEDHNDINVDIDHDACGIGCMASPKVAQARNQAFDAIAANVANTAVEEPLFQSPPIQANSDLLSDFFDFDMYCG